MGTALGLLMLVALAGGPGSSGLLTMLRWHGQLQVVGFLCLFTMGMALLMWPKVLGVPLRTVPAAWASWLAMVVGVVAFSSGHLWLGGGAEALGGGLFAGVLWRTRAAASSSGPVTSEQALFLITGIGWLIASPGLMVGQSSAGLELLLWGFLGLTVAGLGLRLHPGLLGVKGVWRWPARLAALFWNGGLVLRGLGWGPAGVGCVAFGVLLFLVALRPFRRSQLPPGGMAWLRSYVRLSYGWLALATGLLLGTELGYPQWASAARHAVATGFLLTMVVGMAFRMLLAFEGRRLRWLAGPWWVLGCLAVGHLARVGGQLLASREATLGGAVLQSLGIAAFLGLILSATRIPFPAPLSVSRLAPVAPDS